VQSVMYQDEEAVEREMQGQSEEEKSLYRMQAM
jgi:hypothetical protein